MTPFDHVFARTILKSATATGSKSAVLADTADFIDTNGNPIGGQNNIPVMTAPCYVNPDPPASDGTCCEGLATKEDGGGTIFAMRDLRLNKRIPAKVGSVGISHYGGGFIDLAWNADHNGTNLTILVPRLSNDAIDKSHGLIFDSTTGNSSIVMSHQDGQSVVLAKDKGSISLTASDGEHSLNVATDGVSIAAKNGTKIVGGVIVGDPSTAAEVALVQQVIDAFNALVGVLTTAFATNAVNGAPLDPGWVAGLSSVTTAITALGAAGKATTLKASPV